MAQGAREESEGVVTDDALMTVYRTNRRAVVSLSATATAGAHKALLDVLTRFVPPKPIYCVPPYFFNYEGCHRVIWVSNTHTDDVITPLLLEAYAATGFMVWETTHEDVLVWEASRLMVDARTVWYDIARALKRSDPTRDQAPAGDRR